MSYSLVGQVPEHLLGLRGRVALDISVSYMKTVHFAFLPPLQWEICGVGFPLTARDYSTGKMRPCLAGAFCRTLTHKNYRSLSVFKCITSGGSSQ